ncbi:hypothetical protein R1sor_016230 [Riccia sorocarpa]|uniref:Uncharacterized protein n=1 Tax=Riccia sorocarpa TaxID=122646 RepID=A0ABD3HIJ9_9MARC
MISRELAVSEKVAIRPPQKPKISLQKISLNEEDDLGDLFDTDEKMPDSARSTANKNAWVETLQSPSRSGLLSYAENMANYMAELPTPTSTRVALLKHNIHGRAIHFVDDEAREASSESPE